MCEVHGLRTPREEKAFTARPKIQSQSQIFRYGQSIFCLPHRPNFSDIFDLCLHWVSVVRAGDQSKNDSKITDVLKKSVEVSGPLKTMGTALHTGLNLPNATLETLV